MNRTMNLKAEVAGKPTVTSQPCGKCPGGDYEVTIPAGLGVGEVMQALLDAGDTHRATHAGDPVHIRRQIAGTRTRSTTNPLTDSAAFRSGADRDGSQTLCGAQAGTDLSWAETRNAGSLARVTCEGCKRLRASGPAN